MIGITNQYYLFYLILFFYILVIYEIIIYFKKILLISTYVFFSFFVFTYYFNSYFDYMFFNLFILTIVCFDVFSYILGAIFGKRKLLPKISPNKTWSGLVSGLLFSNFLSLSYVLIFYELSFYYVIFINLVIAFSFFGDIIQSYFKRISKIKNSSNLITGHGGFFDRIDSFSLSVYILLAFNLIK